MMLQRKDDDSESGAGKRVGTEQERAHLIRPTALARLFSFRTDLWEASSALDNCCTRPWSSSFSACARASGRNVAKETGGVRVE